MANVLVDETALQDIADAIRMKNGTSNTYKPGQMADAIEAIPSGGITPTGTVNITQNGTTDVTQYASANVNVPNSYAAGDEGKVVSNGALVAQGSDTVTANDTYDTTLISSLTVNVSGGGGISFDNIATRSITGDVVLSDTTTSVAQDAFVNCTGITGLVGNGLVSIGLRAFQYCHLSTTKIYLPNLTTLAGSDFFNTTNGSTIDSVILPKVTAIPGDSFRGCKIKYIDLGADCASIENRAFGYNGTGTKNIVVVLRRTAGVVTLANDNSLLAIDSNTRIYVPSALISSYQSASIWSAKYASYPNLFQALEGSAYENAYADGTPIPT